MADIKERVLKIIANQLGKEVEEINENTDIQNDLGADSLDVAELLISFEEEFNITIDEQEAQNLVTIEDVITAVSKAAK